MIRQICSIKPEDVATVRESELLAKLELEDLDQILREREGFAGLGMWSALVVQSEQHVIYRLMAGGGREAKKLMERDCPEWKLTTVDPQERNTWRSGGRLDLAVPFTPSTPNRQNRNQVCWNICAGVRRSTPYSEVV